MFHFNRIHSWGGSLEEAFEQCAMGMFGYMTDTETVEPIDTVEVESEGEDSCPINLSDAIDFTSTCFVLFFLQKVKTWSHFSSTSSTTGYTNLVRISFLFPGWV